MGFYSTMDSWIIPHYQWREVRKLISHKEKQAESQSTIFSCKKKQESCSRWCEKYQILMMESVSFAWRDRTLPAWQTVLRETIWAHSRWLNTENEVSINSPKRSHLHDHPELIHFPAGNLTVTFTLCDLQPHWAKRGLRSSLKGIHPSKMFYLWRLDGNSHACERLYEQRLIHILQWACPAEFYLSELYCVVFFFFKELLSHNPEAWRGLKYLADLQTLIPTGRKKMPLKSNLWLFINAASVHARHISKIQ